MIAKCKCNNCQNNIEFDVEQAGTVVECPHCQQPTTLLVESKPPPIPEPKTSAPVTEMAKKLTAQMDGKGALKKLRTETNYGALRTWIDFCVRMVQIALAFLLVCGVVGSIVGTFQEGVMVLFGGIVGCVLLVALFTMTLAAKQALVLLIDIADATVATVGNAKA